MPQNAFFLRTHDLLVSKKPMQRHFFPTLHPLSTVIFATATVLVFVLLRDSRFNFHCYIHSVKQRLLKNRPGSDTATSRDFLRERFKKGIHSCKPASPNRPITLEVEPRIAKQYKCHHCCSCQNYRGKWMQGGKKVSLRSFLADQKIASL